MPHELAPRSVVINNGATVRNADVICEQPNGNRLLALVNVFPIRDNEDEVIGAVNIFRHEYQQDCSWLTRLVCRLIDKLAKRTRFRKRLGIIAFQATAKIVRVQPTSLRRSLVCRWSPCYLSHRTSDADGSVRCVPRDGCPQASR